MHHLEDAGLQRELGMLQPLQECSKKNKTGLGVCKLDIKAGFGLVDI